TPQLCWSFGALSRPSSRAVILSCWGRVSMSSTVDGHDTSSWGSTLSSASVSSSISSSHLYAAVWKRALATSLSIGST
ncbi:hypothetical protein BJ741DRAFT_611084, partial [Chytriomyces cf. hyalinus JEL632]